MEADRDAYAARVRICADPATGLVRAWCMAENALTAKFCARCGNILDSTGFGRRPFGRKHFGSPSTK